MSNPVSSSPLPEPGRIRREANRADQTGWGRWLPGTAIHWTLVQQDVGDTRGHNRSDSGDEEVVLISADDKPAQYTKGQELRSFLFLTVVMAPVLTGAIIVVYGFLVWLFQALSGPPTGG
jgi:periplasmic nitrate reductase NapE